MSKKSITLLIEAHGDEDLDIAVNVPRVKLLSFSGQPGELGNFGMVNEQSLELYSLRLLRDLYKDKSNAGQQEEVYEDNKLPDRLQALYERAGKTYPGGGFIRTHPVRQRTFYFKPNTHEDCRRCRKVKKLAKYDDGSMRPNPVYSKVCIPNRKLTSRDCPVYGLIVVASSDPADKKYTLEGSVGNEINDLSSSNLHMNNGAQLHWLQKLQKIDQMQFPKALLAFKHMIENRNISLTQLSKIFEALGYTDIYILDPSCRDVKQNKATPLKKVQAAAELVGISRVELRRRNPADFADTVTYARPLPSREEPDPEVIDETTDMEIDNGNGTRTTVDSQGRTWSCDINGVCALIGAATGALASRAGFPANYALGTGLAATALARGVAYKALGRGGRKSKKQRKNKNRKNKTTKRRNKNKTRKHK